MIGRGLTVSALLTLSLAPSLGAQAPTTLEAGDVVDRVVAVVGDSVVLMTQVLEQVEQIRLQNADEVPSQPGPAMDRFQRQVLDDLVNQLVVLRAAAKDSIIEVDEERVGEIVNQELQSRARQYPSGQTGMLEALNREGLTLAQYRDMLTSQVRQLQLQQMYVQRHVQDAAPMEVSDTELQQAFDQAQANLTQRPRLVSFDQVVLAPAPSDSAKGAARVKARAILDSIRAGSDFAEMAERYSQDPGTAESGGDLGWFRRGQMVREFEDAAFSLPPGAVSDIVESDFGYHIIKVERARSGEVRARHILFRPELGGGDLGRARAQADTVAEKARAGTPMDQLYDEYADPMAPDTLTVSYQQLQQLPPGYDVLRDATEGEVLGPIQYDAGGGEQRLAVMRVRRIREAGAYTFDDVKAQLAQQVQQRKQYQRLLNRLKAETHIEILM
jgi:peptidyl-prolyl cis-trans isomerase SurA